MRRLAFLAAALYPATALAQLDAEKFLFPPKPIADLVTAPRHLNVTLGNFSPTGEFALVARGQGMPSMAQMAKPYVNLGGEMIDPAAFRDRALAFRSAGSLELRPLSGGEPVVIKVEGATLGAGEWSPDGKRVAFMGHYADRTHLYVYDLASKRTTRVSDDRVNTGLVAKIQWTDRGSKLVTVVVPSGIGAFPAAPAVPDQPLVRVTDKRRNSIRTFRTLLQNPYEQQQFEYLCTAQLVRYDEVQRGWSRRNIGKPALIRAFDASPKGDVFRVTTTLKPFSYLVPVGSFGSKEELWDLEGKVLSELNKRELTFEDPPAGGGGPGARNRETGKRNLQWRPDGEGMSFLRQAPAEEGKSEASRKDQLVQWLPPFGDKDVKVIYEQDARMASVRYNSDVSILLISETQGTNETVQMVRLNQPSQKTQITTRKSDEFLANPGTLMSAPNAWGVDTVRTDGVKAFLTGTVYGKDPTQEAPRPFLDGVDLATGKATRIWQSPADRYETVTGIAKDNALVIRRESPTTVPNQYRVELDSKAEKALTTNTDYAPDVTAANKYRIRIKRADGFEFWAEVTTPKWAAKGIKLPAMFWFYPNEFRDQKGYDDSKRTYNKNAFPTLGAMSLDYLVSLGYAVVEPDCPIIGTAAAINDNYVHDLRNNLYATIEELDKQGLIDRNRLALGGHSYGAFSTLNAMVHTPFFKAGIAGDGNYNRSLTPFAFQSETRKLWDAKTVYQEMSALNYADRLTGAVLLYHGMDDQNVGTDPINSVRMFMALEALGKDAALYMYPYEDHGPASRETLLDMWARWTLWLEKYLGK